MSDLTERRGGLARLRLALAELEPSELAEVLAEVLADVDPQALTQALREAGLLSGVLRAAWQSDLRKACTPIGGCPVCIGVGVVRGERSRELCQCGVCGGTGFEVLRRCSACGSRDHATGHPDCPSQEPL